MQYIGLAHGVIGIILFRFRNPNRDNLNVISIATCLLFLSEIAFFKIAEPIGLGTWFIAATGLLIAYGFRFKRKEAKTAIDYMKFAVIVLVACYPINFYTLSWYANDLTILIAIGYLIVPMGGATYLYDRWILKPEKMKRKFVTVLIIQTVLIFITLAFAFVRNAEKVRTEEIAAKLEKLATENARKAHELRKELENCR